MYGYIEGFSETDDIHFCPKCGRTIVRVYDDGTALCDGCSYHFGVLEIIERKDLEDGKE